MKLDKAIDLAEKQYGGSLPSRIMADCDIAHAFNDLKEGNLGSARKLVGKIKDLLRKTKREREDVWVKTAGSARVANACGILESELCLAEGSIDKAIHIGESVPSIGILGFVLVLSTSADQALHNYPIERDVLARAYVKKGDLAKAIAIIVVSLLSITAVFISMKIHRVLDYRDNEMSHLLAAGNNKEIVTNGKDYSAKKALIKAIDQNNRDLAFSLLKDICDRNMGKRKSVIYKIFTSIGNLFTAFFALCGILSLSLGLYLLVSVIVCRK
jgi:hypothetical protein